MRRWFVRWLKTQWTAVPLAFLIVTAIEVWRIEDGTTGDDGRNCREARELAAGPPSFDAVKFPSTRVTRTPSSQLPSTKPPSKIVQKPISPIEESRKDVIVVAASANNRTRANRPWRKYGQAEIDVDTSGPVVNPHPFKYIINCPDLCRDADVFLLNYVHTAVEHYTRRARIRSTWALRSRYRNVTIRTVFFVGLSNKTSWFQDALFYESRKYGDIVQKDFLDTYK